MADENYKRKLTAILSADVAGYSRLMGDDEVATVSTLKTNRNLITDKVQAFNGRVVDSPGDNLLAEFRSIVDAVSCAVAIQEGLRAENDNLPENRKMNFRIGVNLGDVIQDGDRIYGDGVNIAARIEGLSDPGGVAISGTAFDNVRNKLDCGYQFSGEHVVKNIANPVRVYKILTDPECAGKVIGEKRFLGRMSRRVAMSAILISAIIIGALVSYYIYLHQSGRIEPASVKKMAFPLPDKPSIAVLPFDNMSGDSDQTYIADGISENIIAALSKIPELFVISRNSTFNYKGKPVKVQQIAEDLGVRYVLEGSIQKSGERLRVTAQLIDALKGHHVWSEKYDRKLEDLFGVQDDITLNIAVAMQVELTEGEQAQVRHQTENLQAWSLAVKAQGLFETYRKDDNAKARELFERSVELDPNYAYAWTYLGWTYWIDAVYYHMYYDRKEWLENAETMAQKALSINDKSSDAYALLSGVYLSQGKYDEAVAAGNKSISLDPNGSENHAIVAITMQNVGDGEAVVALINHAMRLNPNFPPWYWYRLGIGYRLLGRYEESAAALQKRVDIAKKANNPIFGIYLSLATTYSMMGRVEEAKAAVAKALEVNPKITIETWCKSQLYKDPKEVQKIRDALSIAGLK